MLASLYFIACKMLDNVAQILWSVATVRKCHISSKSLQQLLFIGTAKEREGVMQSEHMREGLESPGTSLPRVHIRNNAAPGPQVWRQSGLSMALITRCSKFNYFWDWGWGGVRKNRNSPELECLPQDGGRRDPVGEPLSSVRRHGLTPENWQPWGSVVLSTRNKRRYRPCANMAAAAAGPP